MGYSCHYAGELKIDPPLNEFEIEFLNNFFETRRCIREGELFKGKYYLSNKDNIDDINGKGSDTLSSVPSLWCDCKIINNELLLGTQNSNIERWLQFLIENFFNEEAYFKILCPDDYKKFNMQPHKINGTFYGKGENIGDIRKIVIDNNQTFYSFVDIDFSNQIKVTDKDLEKIDDKYDKESLEFDLLHNFFSNFGFDNTNYSSHHFFPKHKITKEDDFLSIEFPVLIPVKNELDEYEKILIDKKILSHIQITNKSKGFKL